MMSLTFPKMKFARETKPKKRYFQFRGTKDANVERNLFANCCAFWLLRDKKSLLFWEAFHLFNLFSPRMPKETLFSVCCIIYRSNWSFLKVILGVFRLRCNYPKGMSQITMFYAMYKLTASAPIFGDSITFWCESCVASIWLQRKTLPEMKVSSGY